MSAPLQARFDRLGRARSAAADVVVVGGGINGAGVALDSAARGLSTVLVERDDLAAGTSSRSSKLIHGGLRYLEHFRFGLVREALAERHLLASRLAPHLVRIERFVVPVHGPRWHVPYIAAGLTLYDRLGGGRAGRHRRIPRSEVSAVVPLLRTVDLDAAFEYSDGVVDDARFAVAVARTASRFGARLLTRFEVVDFHRSSGTVAGVVVRDLLTGEETVLPGRVVIDATGAFDSDTDSRLRPSRGSHILVPKERISSRTGLTLRLRGRVVFLIPWGGHWLIGTTDVPHEGPVDRPTATAGEVAYLIDAVRRSLHVQLGPEDIVSTYAGVRPLVGEGEDTVSISREESIYEREPNLIAVRGGKYTTYRRVAARAVDKAAASLGPVPDSPTAHCPLVGAVPPTALASLTREVASAGVEIDIARHLVSRYGSEAFEVVMLARAEGLDGRLVDGLEYLEAEVAWAVRREHALSLDDVLARRTRIAIEDRAHGAAAVERVARLMGEELGWDSTTRERSAQEYLEQSSREYGVPPLFARGVEV